MHSLPVLMNIVSNLLLGSLNVTETIQIWSNPLVQVSSSPKITLEHWGEGRASPQKEGKAGWDCQQGLGGCEMCWHFALQVVEGEEKGAWEEDVVSGIKLGGAWSNPV